jgi:hypothetical protein
MCVRFQWHIKRPYLLSIGSAWGFSDTPNDCICIPHGVREVSATHQTTVFALHRVCVRFQWHTKRLYLHYTECAWGFSDTFNYLICIPLDVLEVSVTHKTTVLHSTGCVWGFSDTFNYLVYIPQDVIEVSVTHKTILFAFLAPCLHAEHCCVASINNASGILHISRLSFY